MQDLRVDRPSTAARDGGPGPGRERFGLDRFTLAIAVGVIALVAGLLALVLARPAQSPPLDESRPAGVVHNYYLALLQDDPRTAYGYLSAEAQAKLPYEQFARQASLGRAEPRVRIDEERIEGDTARVAVRLSYPSAGGFFPFSSDEHTIQQTVVLRREAGAWKLAPTESFGRVPYGW